MNTIRSVCIIFVIAVAVCVMQSGCTPIAMAKIAMSSDPVNPQEQRDNCEHGVSEMDEHYHKTTTSVKHTSKVVCK